MAKAIRLIDQSDIELGPDRHQNVFSRSPPRKSVFTHSRQSNVE